MTDDTPASTDHRAAPADNNAAAPAAAVPPENSGESAAAPYDGMGAVVRGRKDHTGGTGNE